MPEIFDVIQTASSNLVKNLIFRIPEATGETGDSLRIEIKQHGTKYTMQLYGRPFFMALDTGRKPTPDKKPSRDMIDRIRRWVNAVGMPESAVWAVATNIQKKGTQLWREGGNGNVVAPAIDDFITEIANKFLEAQADNLVFKIRQMKWE
jgi:hypothetical protein